jgi:TRAP-type C4-dicarboxylate transport system permease small subunit
MFAALFTNVVLRYALGSGIAWAYEIHALLLPWLVAGGLVVATARSGNIAVTILPGLLPDAGRRALEVAVQVAILTISVSVLWTSQPILRASQFQTLSTLGITQIWGYSSLVFAFGAMAILAAATILRVLTGDDPAPRDPVRASLS